jgi:hypothetical protein
LYFKGFKRFPKLATSSLGKLDPLEGEWTRFHADDPLLAFLASL